MTIFSKEHGICLVEEIIGYNKYLIHRVFPPVEEIIENANDAPASVDSDEPEAVAVKEVNE